MADRKKTLDQLEGVTTGPPDYDSHLVRRCTQLRRVPLDAFTAEDLRITLGQGISPFFLAPVALDLLEHRPLTSGDFYPGDLLASLVRARAGWQQDAGLRRRVVAVLDRALDDLPHRLANDHTEAEEPLSAKLVAELGDLFRSSKRDLETIIN